MYIFRQWDASISNCNYEGSLEYIKERPLLWRCKCGKESFPFCVHRRCSIHFILCKWKALGVLWWSKNVPQAFFDSYGNLVRFPARFPPSCSHFSFLLPLKVAFSWRSDEISSPSQYQLSLRFHTVNEMITWKVAVMESWSVYLYETTKRWLDMNHVEPNYADMIFISIVRMHDHIIPNLLYFCECQI